MPKDLRLLIQVSTWTLSGVRENKGGPEELRPGNAMPWWGVFQGKICYFWLNFDGEKGIFFDGGRLGYGLSDIRNESMWLRKCRVEYLVLDAGLFGGNEGLCWNTITDAECVEVLIMVLVSRSREYREAKGRLEFVDVNSKLVAESEMRKC